MPPERPPLTVPSCSRSSLPPRSPSSRPAEPRKEPLVCCVSCSSSEFYSAPLTLADRPQGKGQKDNCLQQFCPQLVSPSACRAAQPARHCLTNSIKFNSCCCEQGGGARQKKLNFWGLLLSFPCTKPEIEVGKRGRAKLSPRPCSLGGLWDGSRGAGASIPSPAAAPSCAACTPGPERAALGGGRLHARLRGDGVPSRSCSSWSRPSTGAASWALLMPVRPPPVLLLPITASSSRAGLVAAVFLREPQTESVCPPKHH